MPPGFRSLFTFPWFSRGVFSGLHAALHEGDDELLSREGSFMSQLMLQLLDLQRGRQLYNRGLYEFYAFCQSRLPISRSQILQDLWVLFMLGEKRDGYFVEFGACDGVALSNTLLLEQEYGWKGILAEPNRFWHDALTKNRSCNISRCCVSSESGRQVSFAHIPDMPEISRMRDIVPDDIHERNGNRLGSEVFEVGTVSLIDLLYEYQAPKTIDYLSIDTEGSELAILKAFDFAAYRFRLITVEHAGETAKRESIRRLLEDKGYRRWRPELTRWDDWYVDVGSDAV